MTRQDTVSTGVSGWTRGLPVAATRHRRSRLDSRVLLAVGAGGALGTAARYELIARAPATSGFPWAVFAINLFGSFLLGVLVTLLFERWPPTRYVRPAAGIGFCGGLTTFSTWMVDSVLLFREAAIVTGVAYVAATTAAGLVALYAGVVAVRALPDRTGGRS